MRRALPLAGLLLAWGILLGAPSCPPPKPEPTPEPCTTCPAGQHCEGTECVPDPPPPCPELGVPWCHEAEPPMTCGACKHQPAGERCPIMAPECPPPQPTCPATCPPGMACTDPAAGCVPTPPPPVDGCSIDGEPGPVIPGYKPQLGSAINDTMTSLRPECAAGSRCVLPDTRQGWQARVIEALRRRGLCAGQHSPTTDEIAVATSVTAPREGWHVYAGSDAGPGTVVWSPGAARPTYAAPSGPPPVEPPDPPPAGACPPAMVAAIQDPAARQMVAKPAACKRCYDATPRVCDHPAAAVIAGRPGQRCVPLGPDGSEIRVACETLFLGGESPLWQNEAEAGGVLVFDPYPYGWQVKAFGAGRLRACDRHGVTCSPWLEVP